MSWSAKQSATTGDDVTTERLFDATPTLADDGLAHCQVTVTFPPNPKDDAIIRVYATLDDDNGDWDTQLFGEHLIEKVHDDTARISFTVSGVYRFRIGVQSAGTLVSADFSYRLSGQPEQSASRAQPASRAQSANRAQSASRKPSGSRKR
jgi:hypothetical protein